MQTVTFWISYASLKDTKEETQKLCPLFYLLTKNLSRLHTSKLCAIVVISLSLKSFLFSCYIV